MFGNGVRKDNMIKDPESPISCFIVLIASILAVLIGTFGLLNINGHDSLSTIFIFLMIIGFIAFYIAVKGLIKCLIKKLRHTNSSSINTSLNNSLKPNKSSIIEQVAAQMGLNYFDRKDIAIGEYHGFSILIYPIYISKGVCYGATIFCSPDCNFLNSSKLHFEEMPLTSHPYIYKHEIKFSIGSIGDDDTIVNRIKATIVSAVSALKKSGNNSTTPVSAINLNDPSSYYGYAGVFEGIIKDNDEKENILKGILGSLIGATIGFLLMVITQVLGYTSVLIGMFLGIITISAYMKFAKNFSIIGCLITSSIILIITYLAFRTSIAILIYKDMAGLYSFGDIYRNSKNMYKELGLINLYNTNMIKSILPGMIGGLASAYFSISKIRKK